MRRHKRAFRLFLLGARAGDSAAQLNLGYFYDRGIGVNADVEKAIYWYRRAYRRGNPSGAANIGTIMRDRGAYQVAIRWFERALRKGDAASALDLAQMYVRLNQGRKALGFLRATLRSDEVSDETRQIARRLLARLSSPTRPEKARS